MTLKTSLKTEYITETKYDAFMFKVLSKDDNELLNKLVKEYEGNEYIYIKMKHLKKMNKDHKWWKLTVLVDEFTNNEDKLITYVKAAKVKQITEPVESPCFSDSD